MTLLQIMIIFLYCTMYMLHSMLYVSYKCSLTCYKILCGLTPKKLTPGPSVLEVLAGYSDLKLRVKYVFFLKLPGRPHLFDTNSNYYFFTADSAIVSLTMVTMGFDTQKKPTYWPYYFEACNRKHTFSFGLTHNMYGQLNTLTIMMFIVFF
jgi:hypothetical protein